jgi:hypothetical protein
MINIEEKIPVLNVLSAASKAGNGGNGGDATCVTLTGKFENFALHTGST